MKNTVSQKVTRRVLISLSLVLVILLTAAFLHSYKTVTDRNREYGEAIATVYVDLLKYGTGDNGISVLNEPDEIVRLGDYLCNWYAIDYAYVYIPDPATDTITFLGASRNPKNIPEPLENDLMGLTIDRTPNKEELALWNEEILYAHNNERNVYGHELGTLTYAHDKDGTKFVAGVDISYKETYRRIFEMFSLITLALVVSIVGFYFILRRIIRKQVSEPAQTLSGAMQEFLSDGTRSDVRLNENGPAEFATMAASFNRMTENIDRYVENIGALNSERERQQTELDIASRIQKGFLPAPFFDGKDHEIRARMTPARDVGGDLYDYLALEDGRTLITVADVSGKGIAASIFMSVTLILIRQFARLGLPPDEILRRTNDTLSENNAAMMFATAFVGIYDRKTKCLTYANAGHNLPYLIGREIEKLDGGTGTLLGLYPDETYPKSMIRLRTGDTVFLYTDGVSEACDRNRWFYGTDRLERTLASVKAAHTENVIAAVSDDLAAFTDGAEQHDDITMLTLTVKQTTELSLDFSVGELTKIKEAVFALPIPREHKLALVLAAEECFVNICSYAFEDMIPAGEKVAFTLTYSDRVTMRFADRGMPFDPREKVKTPDEYDIDTQVGGLGRYIAFANVDSVDYVYRDKQNILTLTKFIEEETK